MKKTILVCAAVLVLAVLVAAPLKAASKLSFGVKAGLSGSDVVWTGDSGDKWVFQPTIGVLAVIPLTPTLALQPELNYLTVGESYFSDTEQAQIKSAFHYLHMPILLRAQLAKEGKFIPLVEVGPYFGYMLSGKEGTYDVKEILRSTEFGVDFGVGGMLGLGGKMKGLIDLRWVQGLSNNFKGDFIEGYAERSRAVVLTFGILF